MLQTVYISSPKSKQIFVWQLDDCTEKLKLIQTISTLGFVQPMIVHPNKQFLYVGIRPDFGIITYQINTDGSLSKIKTIKIFASPTYLTINKQGTFLYCASYNYNSISIFSINKFGVPDNSVQTITGLLGCHSVNIDKQEKLLWIPCLQENSIRLFYINMFTGMLSPYNPDRIIINSGSGPRHMIFHSYSPYAYIINELSGTINVIEYDLYQTAPIIIQTLRILPNNMKIQKFWAADIHITPNNRWLYCSDRSSNTISCFEICSTTKQLNFISYQFTETQPRGFAIDSMGKFIIIAGEKSHRIALYRILTHGKLQMISSYPSGIGPIWVSIL